jgi:hypothetical protein
MKGTEISVPRIFKMPKPPPRTQPQTPNKVQPYKEAETALSVPKTPPLAEIILFPNAKEVIAGVSEAQTDTHTKTRWLKLADEVLESGESPKKP